MKFMSVRWPRLAIRGRAALAATTVALSSGVMAQVPAAIPDAAASVGTSTTISLISTQWGPNDWGGATYAISHSGGSVTFTVISKGTGNAHLRSPLNSFVPGRRYKANVTLAAPNATAANPVLVSVSIRSDVIPYPTAAAASRLLKSSQPVTVPLEGVYRADMSPSASSLRVELAAPGTIRVDAATVETFPAGENFLAPPSSPLAVPSTFPGLHFDLGANTPWPALGQKIVRLWDTGTKWSDIDTSDGCMLQTSCWTNTSGGRRLQFYVNHVTSHGGQLIYVLGQTPTWAASDPSVPCVWAPGGCVAPANLEKWRQYVRALAVYYKGKIKYWELWNEVDMKVMTDKVTGLPKNGFWIGTEQEMVDLARIAYEEIKAADPTNVVLSPSVTTSGLVWLSKYFALGGDAYTDQVALHGYWQQQITPLQEWLPGVRGTMASHGLAGRALWNTEGAPRGEELDPIVDPSAKRGIVARGLLVQAAKGIVNFNYYTLEAKDQPGFALAQGSNYSVATQPGYAYAVVNNMIAGTAVIDAYARDGIYVVKFWHIASNVPVFAVWADTARPASLLSSWSPAFNNVQKLDGSTQAITTQTYGTTTVKVVDLSPEPIFLTP